MSEIVSRETLQKLDQFEQLVRRWNPKINLVAPASLNDIKARHIEDSLQLSQLCCPINGRWVDLGSGGGFPGLVLAIAHVEATTDFTLVESDSRKVAFLRTVIRELSLTNVNVENKRIEELDPLNAAYLSARALAPLPRLMPYLQRHLAPEGTAWLMKGRHWKEEMSDAEKEWKFKVKAHPSASQDGAAILEISEVFHV
ncbi:16S rRNA (guanine(527)-N(7))-methyltransferase RsmG [Paracoccus caeni]|uniref:Ribosomal RNA small subunit methyltransferase G n=1 Tax=Paracoccus caeni TaxID=657651 RepID=A0A934SNJ3_9RHOB|nr:16S rRNA (guanine(527)-N(7))-methyltransferase RsmG [Paracoccus caeni]MBK4217573.1 16S rRNA (guanine(527)-N(7))-methyltransferase RsmG [Paracoccus caeni]